MFDETILVVDDNPLNLKLVRMILEAKGYKILTSSEGLDALRIAEEAQPKLILLDIQLPGIDGLEVARRLKSNPVTRGITIVAVTAYAMKGDEERARAAGCDGYVTKPIDTKAFPGQVREFLDRTQSAGAPKVVLLVDDDPVQLKLQALEFERAGYAVTSAEDGASALARAANSHVDVIVSDVLMPRLDGFRLCQAVRHDARLGRVPIVLVTSGSVERADEELARGMGANAIVVRMGNSANVLDAVKKALAEGAVGSAEFNMADLAAIADEFLSEGIEQSRRLADEVPHGIDVATARRLAHRWAGTGGTLGFPQISQLAFEIERLLEKHGDSAPDLEQRFCRLGELFQSAADSRREGVIPAWVAGMLSGRGVALVGFSKSDTVRMVKALETAGARVSFVDEDQVLTSGQHEVWIVHASSRNRATALAPAGRVLFAGGADILRDGVFEYSGLHDLLVEPWTAEEVVTRCQRLLSATGPSAAKPVLTEANRVPQILIADDDPTTVAIVRSIFEGHGMKCRTTNTGGDVVSLAEAAMPDAIVLDVNLPQMDGFQVLSAIRHHPKLARCFVVMLTARQQETDIMKGFGLGADDYVLKPFSPMELVARVRRLLRERVTS